jgi:hypothetical protein
MNSRDLHKDLHFPFSGIFQAPHKMCQILNAIDVMMGYGADRIAPLWDQSCAGNIQVDFLSRHMPTELRLFR